MLTFATYDLRRPGQAWPEMDAALKALGGVRPLQTTWFFPKSVGVETVGLTVNAIADSNDRWIVGSAEVSWVGGLGQSWLDWFNRNQ